MPRDWRAPTKTMPAATHPPCELYTFKAPGYFVIGATTTTVTADVVFTPSCFNLQTDPTGAAYNNGTDELDTEALRDPFYSSIVPMSFTLAACTTVGYMLLIFLFLCPPRSRPWLQKAATVMVVVCLTVVMTKTTSLLATDYNMATGQVDNTESTNAFTIRRKIGDSKFIRVGRIISDIFLWLAQVQTLVRLFPRHREKVILKWAGYALIALDALFAILIFFTTLKADRDQEESPFDAVPALSYLFQISLAVLYATCVLYYCTIKRKYAFYHRKRKNMPLLATLSLLSVAAPITFFCLDISNKNLNTWVDYVRWVSAAAASIVVWEWVDRIEELERDARRDGVLGREIYDGDDGLDDYSADFRSDDSGDEKGKDKNGRVTADLGMAHSGKGSEEETYPPLPLSRSNTFASTVGGSAAAAYRNHTSSRSPPVQDDNIYMSRGALPAESGNSTADEDVARRGEEIHEVGTATTLPTESGDASKTGEGKARACKRLRNAPAKVVGSISNLRQRKNKEAVASKSKTESASPSSLEAIGQKIQAIPTSLQGVFARPPREPKEKRTLPVTFIPAPPRNLTMTLRELEEARESGCAYPGGLYRTNSDENDPRPAAIRANAQSEPGPIQAPIPSSPEMSREGSVATDERHSSYRYQSRSSSSAANDLRSARSSTTPSSHGRHSITPANPNILLYSQTSPTLTFAPPLPTTQSMHSPSAPPYITQTPENPPPNYSQADAARFQSAPNPLAPAATITQSQPHEPLNNPHIPSISSSTTPGTRDLTPPPAAGNGIRRTVLEREVPEEEDGHNNS